jgi:hypothetical protein
VRIAAARAATIFAVTAALLFASVGAQTPGVKEASVVDLMTASAVHDYPTVDHGPHPSARDDRNGTTEWLVVLDTGNCCENYLTITPEGRLLDFGGTYINFTDDRGRTWKQVRPASRLSNGEGAIVVAPGGDVLGVQWDPYSGDHLIAFKYVPRDDKWLFNELPVHTPFFDREWIAVVPGPFTIEGRKVPYISFVKGAWPSKELWFYSTDGLDYTQISSKFVDRTLADVEEKDLQVGSHEELDWIQPNTNGRLTPLGHGGALAGPDSPFGDEWALLDPEELRWSGYRFKDGTRPEGRFQVDSAGRLHNVIPKESKFKYRISSNGGHSWRTVRVSLPKKHEIEEVDFRANRAVGVAAVAIHSHDKKSDKDRDLLYKFDIRSGTANLLRTYEVGLGDINGASGFGASIRFDFETVAIFPDGRVAMSFYDSTTGNQPALAIERASSF